MMIRIVLVGSLVLAAGAYAQEPGRGPGRRGGGPDAGGPPGDVRLIGAMPGRQNRVVKNAPFSADMVTETTQTLAGGNRIHQTSAAKIYRDSEGRERNEQSLNGLGALAPNLHLPPVVYINDPVAGVDYALNQRDKIAMRSTAPPPGRAGRGMGQRPEQAQNGPPTGSVPPIGGRWGRGNRADGATRQNVKTESLGRQTIEGVPADGTRTTVTIPAGSEMGNEQPILIVSETWYSPDLQTVVLFKHADPRAGETVSRLSNINRAEPAPSLFQPPADYKVTTGGMGGGRGPMSPPHQ